MEKITTEMRARLREPLPSEAVSQHPTKTYLSSIKSIYVAERINDVFGIGTWTLKGELVERIEKFVVVKTILEIPEYGFYGEAYGGNDNNDPGDAYKGAVTDGFTKISGQQLEIGIDVFKGIKSEPSRQATTSKSSPVKEESSSEHWCKQHGVKYFKSAKMKSYAHPISGSNEWCYEHSKEVSKPSPEGTQSSTSTVTKVILPDTATIKKICSDAGVDVDALNELVKERYDGLTWGKLADERKLEVLDSLKVKAKEIEPEDIPF